MGNETQARMLFGLRQRLQRAPLISQGGEQLVKLRGALLASPDQYTDAIQYTDTLIADEIRCNTTPIKGCQRAALPINARSYAHVVHVSSSVLYAQFSHFLINV